MRVIVFDTETTGLPKFRKAHPSKSEWYPYICQFSWLVFDDKTNEVYTGEYTCNASGMSFRRWISKSNFKCIRRNK